MENKNEYMVSTRVNLEIKTALENLGKTSEVLRKLLESAHKIGFKGILDNENTENKLFNVGFDDSFQKENNTENTENQSYSHENPISFDEIQRLKTENEALIEKLNHSEKVEVYQTNRIKQLLEDIKQYEISEENAFENITVPEPQYTNENQVIINLESITDEDIKEYLIKKGFEQDRYLTPNKEENIRKTFDQYLQSQLEEQKSKNENIKVEPQFPPKEVFIEATKNVINHYEQYTKGVISHLFKKEYNQIVAESIPQEIQKYYL